jgi:hypothetical protein
MKEAILLESQDANKLSQVLEAVTGLTIENLLDSMVGPVDEQAVAAIAAECSFDHGAALVFPGDITDVIRFFHERGINVAGPVQSVVVRERIARRYGLAEDELDVSILQASIGLGSSMCGGVEVFCLPRKQATRGMIERERRENNESHFAIKVDRPDSAQLSALRSNLVGHFSMRPDGGGYNPFDGIGTGGRSVLYFAAPGGDRLELLCPGNFSEVVTMHRRSIRDPVVGLCYTWPSDVKKTPLNRTAIGNG